MRAPAQRVHALELTLELGLRPWLMGIVNASPDSFSDGGRYADLDARVRLARELLAAGADILDVGGESASTGPPPLEVGGDRAGRPARAAAGHGGGGARVGRHVQARGRGGRDRGGRGSVNDISGLRDPGLAEVCARTGAALVLMHTRAAPRVRRQDPDLYGDIVAEVLSFLRERIALAVSLGVAPEQLIVDPGPTSPRRPPRRSSCSRTRAACTSSDARC